MNEEIVARFGSNTTGFEQGLQKMRQGAAQAGEAAHASFVHAGNGAREFHKLLHSITEESGLAGVAIKAFISPIGAAITGATLAFGFFKSQIEEINKSSDKLEEGVEKPIVRARDALDAAKKSLAEFEREFQKWQRTHDAKSPAEKLTENLADQLSLLDKQVTVAEKLSKIDQQRLERQKLQIVSGLQGRALHTLADQIGTDDAAVQAAAAENRRLLGKTDITGAEGAIKADDLVIEKQKFLIEEEKKRGGSLWNKAMQYFPNPVPLPGSLEASVTENIADAKKKIEAAEDRQRENRLTIERQTQARKEAAERLSEAQGRLGKTKGLFDNMSHAIESTRQALSVMPADAVAGDVPPSIVATNAWRANIDRKQQAWNKAHGIGDVKVPLTKDPTDKTSNDIAALNAMFAKIIDSAGMSVHMTIEDQ